MNVSRMAWNEGVTHEPDRCDPQECRCGLPWPCEIKRVMDERDELRAEVERLRRDVGIGLRALRVYADRIGTDAQTLSGCLHDISAALTDDGGAG